jgi:hypothetical protein
MESVMFKKTVFAAAAVAVTLAAAPIAATSTAQAGQPHFSFGIQTPHGYFSFGNGGGGYYPQPQKMSCWQAKQYLKGSFLKVHTVECYGNVYTFKVKKFWAAPYQTIKLNSHNGNYWYA